MATPEQKTKTRTAEPHTAKSRRGISAAAFYQQSWYQQS
jgi:hypothetical protein